MTKKVLVVGNCNYDGPRIVEMINSNFKAEAIESKTIDEAESILEKKKYDLILVNRIGNEDKRDGLELINFLKEKKIKTPVMLITNYKDKMAEAVKRGAVKGFGKENIKSKKTITLLKKYLK